MKVLYRYDDVHFSLNDVQVILRQYPITKTTPKGVWVDNYGTPRFVLSGAYKRFACSTQEEALESFIARKTRQVRILAAQQEIVSKALVNAKSMFEKMT